MIRVSLLAVLAACASGCTLLWLFNNDPQGLPCQITKEHPEGECLDGYVCIVENDAPICVHAHTLEAGELCARTDQCKPGLACDIGPYRECAAGAVRDDINCKLIAKEETEKRCRQSCDGTFDDKICNKGERCFTVEDPDDKTIKGVCQPGTCASDSDCATADDDGAVCATAFGGGKTGLCVETCDPISCVPSQGGVCAGCDGLDDDADGLNCIPLVDVLHPGGTGLFPICTNPGGQAAFTLCAVQGAEDCEVGTFCTIASPGDDLGTAYCAPYCSAAGGNPECPNGPEKCQPLSATIGYCLP